MGADVPVQPTGSHEYSHGSRAMPYATGDSAKEDGMSSWLWDMFGKDKEAPGMVEGFGSEPIG